MQKWLSRRVFYWYSTLIVALTYGTLALADDASQAIPVPSAAPMKEPVPQEGNSIAEISDTLLGPIGMLSKMMTTISYIIGFGLLVTAFVRYRQHKQNPNRVRLSEVIYYFCFALFLILLPWLAQYSTGAKIIDIHAVSQ